MHRDIVNNIVMNAFNGMGDSTGSDEFGISVAWLDLGDYLEDYEQRGMDCFELSAEAIEFNGGSRWALAQLDSYGNRSVVAFDTREEMMKTYRSFENDFIEFEASNNEEL